MLVKLREGNGDGLMHIRCIILGAHLMHITLPVPETNSSHLKIGRAPKGNSFSNHPFSGATLVSGRVKVYYS